MDKEENKLLAAWVEQYYDGLVKSSSISGVKVAYYKSLRGYFRHSIILTDIKLQEFGLVDYKIWEGILTLIKSSRSPVISGGLYFKYERFEDVCKRRSFYKTKRKLLDLGLLIKTPFKDFYLLNPLYAIKLYAPEQSNKE